MEILNKSGLQPSNTLDERFLNFQFASLFAVLERLKLAHSCPLIQKIQTNYPNSYYSVQVYIYLKTAVSSVHELQLYRASVLCEISSAFQVSISGIQWSASTCTIDMTQPN